MYRGAKKTQVHPCRGQRRRKAERTGVVRKGVVENRKTSKKLGRQGDRERGISKR